MTVVNEEPSRQPAVSHTPVALWLVWALLILIGGTVVVPFITVCVTALRERACISSGMRPMQWPRPQAGSRMRP